jgi:transcription antitermination factor NusG
MTTKADYTDEEWATLRRAIMVAGFAVSLADPGGPIELTKESMAAMRAAGLPPTEDELLIAVSQDAMAQQQQRHNVIGELDLKAATVREQVVEELGRTAAILDAKATPEEAAAFRQWIVQAAQASADAAKVREVLGLPPG